MADNRKSTAASFIIEYLLSKIKGDKLVEAQEEEKL